MSTVMNEGVNMRCKAVKARTFTVVGLQDSIRIVTKFIHVNNLQTRQEAH